MDITLIKSDDTNFENQVFLVASFKTNLDLLGYTARFTIENPTNFSRKYEIQHNTIQIDLDKSITSTLEIGKHKANIKLYDTQNRIKTVYNFQLIVKDDFNIDNMPYVNEYEIEIVLDNDGINKYKNYNELHNKPSIQGVELKGDKTFQELGIDEFAIGISNLGINKHNNSDNAHEDIRQELSNKQNKLIAGANITIIDGIISSLGAEGGITTDYEALGHKPIINDVTLNGSLSLEELGIQAKGEYVTEEQLEEKGYLTTVPTGYITEEELQAEKFLKEVPEEYFTDEQNEEKYATIEALDTKQNILTAGENINIENVEDNLVISSSIPDNYITETKLAEYNYVNNTSLDTRLARKQTKMIAGDNIRFSNNSDGTITISAVDGQNPKDITSYNALSYKPTINGVALSGNKTAKDLNLQPFGTYQDKLIAGENIELIDTFDGKNTINVKIPDYLATKSDLNSGLSTKANIGETISDYGIKDAYTKNETINHIQDSIKSKVSDAIISAPNGIISYTENTITALKDIEILTSDLDIIKTSKDLTINVQNFEFTDYFIAITQHIDQQDIILIPKHLFKVVNYEVIPNTQQGYIKNLYDNKYYFMSYVGHGIYEPIKLIMKIIGEGKSVITDGVNKIKNITPYHIYQFIKQEDILLSLNNYQEKLSFGDNFEFVNNNVEYKIPYNYVTREYLLENDYAVKVDIYDAVNIHNENNLAHQDIRNEINNVKQNYVTNTRYNNLLNKYNELNDKYNTLNSLVNNIIEKNHLRT